MTGDANSGLIDLDAIMREATATARPSSAPDEPLLPVVPPPARRHGATLLAIGAALGIVTTSAAIALRPPAGFLPAELPKPAADVAPPPQEPRQDLRVAAAIPAAVPTAAAEARPASGVSKSATGAGVRGASATSSKSSAGKRPPTPAASDLDPSPVASGDPSGDPSEPRGAAPTNANATEIVQAPPDAPPAPAPGVIPPAPRDLGEAMREAADRPEDSSNH